MNIRGSTGALAGQTVVVIGGSSGIGLETARRARAEGADVIIAGRDPERLERAAREVAAKRSAAFDATDPPRLARFFEELPAQIDHLMLTAGHPHYGRILDMDRVRGRTAIDDRLSLILDVARHAAKKLRALGSLVFMGGTDSRRPQIGSGAAAAINAAIGALTANLALELAPVRVNLLAAGFVDTRLSASILGDALDARRDELRSTLPIRRVVGPADVAALAVHVMTNTALTGATFDIDGGQQLLAH
jgi:NAD(P)-dependent dehydrogenase (short-subunit alcohol dehydrogenase family)